MKVLKKGESRKYEKSKSEWTSRGWDKGKRKVKQSVRKELHDEGTGCERERQWWNKRRKKAFRFFAYKLPV